MTSWSVRSSQDNTDESHGVLQCLCSACSKQGLAKKVDATLWICHCRLLSSNAGDKWNDGLPNQSWSPKSMVVSQCWYCVQFSVRLIHSLSIPPTLTSSLVWAFPCLEKIGSNVASWTFAVGTYHHLHFPPRGALCTSTTSKWYRIPW